MAAEGKLRQEGQKRGAYYVKGWLLIQQLAHNMRNAQILRILLTTCILLTMLSKIQVCESLTQLFCCASQRARKLLEKTPPSARAPWPRIGRLASSLYGGRGRRILFR